MKHVNTKKIVLLSIFASLAVTLSWFDKIITGLAFPILAAQGYKIGLANIVVLITILNFNFKDSFILVTLKTLISGLLLASITAFTIGAPASYVSFFSMYLVYKLFKDKISVIGISVIGGFTHLITQVLIIWLYFTADEIVAIEGSILIIISLITSIIIGLTVKKLNTYFNKIA